MLSDHGREMGWRDIVPRIPVVGVRGHVKVLFDKLLSPRESVSSAHEGQLSHSKVGRSKLTSA